MRVDMTGMRVGRLKVIEFAYSHKKVGAHWKCLCDCGKTVVVSRKCFAGGKTRSCGCLRKKGSSIFNKGMDEILIRLYQDHGYKPIVAEIAEKYGVNITQPQVQSRANQLGIKSSRYLEARADNQRAASDRAWNMFMGIKPPKSVIRGNACC